jgi:hypothetical protein
MAEEKWTPDSVARVLIDPRYCLVTPPAVTEEKWIAANAKLIREMGAENYLATLLTILRKDYV